MSLICWVGRGKSFIHLTEDPQDRRPGGGKRRGGTGLGGKATGARWGQKRGRWRSWWSRWGLNPGAGRHPSPAKRCPLALWTHLRSGGTPLGLASKELAMWTCGPARWQTEPDRSTTKRNEQGSSPRFSFFEREDKKKSKGRADIRSTIPAPRDPPSHTKTQGQEERKKRVADAGRLGTIPIQKLN